jgi:hypothetical protein
MKFSSINRSLHKPVDNTSLVIFRIAFGLLLALESIGAIFTGWVKRVFVDPQFTFSFIGFEWLQPLPGYGMYYYYALMGICGLLVMVGLFYRYSLGLFTLLWWGCYLMQKTSYNNHYYLLILLCLLMMLVPANRNASLDAKFHFVKATTTCPAWCIYIFKWQLLIVYTYAALAKLYPGWLEGKFISLSFASKENYLLIGELLQEQWIQKLVIIGGVVYDLTIIPVMYWDRGRIFGFYVSVVFHLFNSIVFGIGIFPYLMLASLVLFFPTASWRPKIPGYLTVPESQPNTTHWALTPFLIIYFVIQLWLPVRHYFIPGDVFVTEEGHRMAWRMMLRTKWGSVKYKLVDKESGKSWVVFPREYLSPKQTRKIAGHPDLIWQFSRLLKREYSNQGINSLEVYAIAETYLNGNKIDDLIDPKIDLLSVEWNRFGHNSWILY